MSLIHDALKKAEGENKPPVNNPIMPVPEGSEVKRLIAPRTLVLVVLLVLSLGYFIYAKYLAGPADKKVGPSQLKIAATAEPAKVDNVALLKRRGTDAFKSDDYESAWSNLSAAQNLSPQDAEIWNNMGLVAKKKGDNAKARECYQKALQLKPEYPEALNNLAMLEWSEENLQKAVELLNKALAISPAYPEANFHMALIYDTEQNKTKAVEFYKRFLDVSGSFPSNIVDAVRDRLMEIEE